MEHPLEAKKLAYITRNHSSFLLRKQFSNPLWWLAHESVTNAQFHNITSTFTVPVSGKHEIDGFKKATIYGVIRKTTSHSTIGDFVALKGKCF